MVNFYIDMRERIESIHILDDSPSFVEHQPLDPKLETIYEKLRRSDKKPSEFSYGPVTPKKSQNKSYIDSDKSSPFDFKNYHKATSLLEILKQKFGMDGSEQSKPNGLFGSATKNERENGNWKDVGTTTPKGSFSQGTFGPGSQQYGSQRQGDACYDSRAPANSMISSNPDQIVVESENSQQGGSQDLSQNKREQDNAVENHSTMRKNSKMSTEAEATASDNEHKEGQNIEEEEPKCFLDENSPEFLISQWVDEKLNGFTVFQNTIRDELPECSEEAFNKQTSQRWFQLSRPERDEYTELAMSARAGIKEELKLHDTTEMTELKELANDKIRQIKRQI